MFPIFLFQLETEKQCGYDFVEIFDGADENAAKLGQFCGSDIPAPLNSTTNKLFLRFKTDASGQKKGFRASYMIRKYLADS